MNAVGRKAFILNRKNALHINKLISRCYTPRRALMYVPGDDDRKLQKALAIDVDCIAMDCEDGVAINRKDVARDTIRALLDKVKVQKSRNYDLGVRVNSVDSGLCENDLSVILKGEHLPDTILLPKVENVEHLEWFSDKLNSYITKHKQLNLIMYIESAMAMINLNKICEAAKALSKHNKFVPTSLVFGSDDFCADIGVTRSEDSSEILYARQKLVLYAKAFKLQAIDMVYIQYKDSEGLQRQCVEGARMGFTGKQVIHPGQIQTVQTSFLPNEQQIDWAQGLLKAFKSHQEDGKGAFNYKGSMIDMPTMKQAQNIVDLMASVKEIR